MYFTLTLGFSLSEIMDGSPAFSDAWKDSLDNLFNKLLKSLVLSIFLA